MHIYQSELALTVKLTRMKSEDQAFFGISVRQQSPSHWGALISSLREIKSKLLPSERLLVLLSVAKDIPRVYLDEHPDEDKPLGADEFLPIFIYILVKSQLTHILALNEELQGICDPDNRMSEMGYYLATFEASIQHVMDFDESRGKFSYLSTHAQMLRQSQSHWLDRPSDITGLDVCDIMFDSIGVDGTGSEGLKVIDEAEKKKKGDEKERDSLVGWRQAATRLDGFEDWNSVGDDSLR